MEQYRKRLKREIIIQCVIMVAAVILVVFSYLRYLKLGSEESAGAFFQGFQTGLFMVWAAIMIWGIISSVRALRSEERLKKQYIKQYDERTRTIQTEAQAKAFQISILGMMIAAVISGFYSYTVFYTLLATLIVMCLIAAIGKLFYSRTL